MMPDIQRLVAEKGIFLYHRNNIPVLQSQDAQSGLQMATMVLQQIVDKKTLIFLSGGKTPKELYTLLSSQIAFSPGAVGLVDERFGEPMHTESNENMIATSGLLSFFKHTDVPFYGMLQQGKTREEEAQTYDELVKSLLLRFPKSVATLGIGLDGHIAGIIGNRKDFTNRLFQDSQKNELIGSFSDPKSKIKERITMTFLALSMIDVLLVLVFGKDKKDALILSFSEGSEEEVPARFFLRPEVAKKTLLITDQKV